MKNNPIGWFEIYVTDMPRARSFYEGMLQGKLDKLDAPSTEMGSLEMWAFPMDMTTTGAGGSLVKMEGYAPGSGGIIIYFSCEDVANEAGRAVQFGGQVVQEKMSIGQHGFIALVIDTEGNTIGLHSQS